MNTHIDRITLGEVKLYMIDGFNKSSLEGHFMPKQLYNIKCGTINDKYYQSLEKLKVNQNESFKSKSLDLSK